MTLAPEHQRQRRRGQSRDAPFSSRAVVGAGGRLLEPSNVPAEAVAPRAPPVASPFEQEYQCRSGRVALALYDDAAVSDAHDAAAAGDPVYAQRDRSYASCWAV